MQIDHKSSRIPLTLVCPSYSFSTNGYNLEFTNILFIVHTVTDKNGNNRGKTISYAPGIVPHTHAGIHRMRSAFSYSSALVQRK